MQIAVRWQGLPVWLIRCLLGVALLLAACPCLAKEENPLQGALSPESVTLKAGEEVALTLELATTHPFAQVAVRLKAPSGMTLTAGQAETVLTAFAPADKRVFSFRLRLNEAKGEQKIWAEAEVLGLQEQVIRNVFLSVVNPAPPDPSHAPTFRTDKQGNRYRVQGVSPR